MRIFDKFGSKDAKMARKKLIMMGTLVLVSTIVIAAIGCAEPETAREGYKTYSKYGFSFQYPQSFLLFEQGLLESQANDTSGVVSGSVENEEIKVVSVSWIKAQVSLVDLEAAIEDGLREMEVDETCTSLERGELVETTKARHKMLYEYYTVTYTDIGKLSGIMGVWYCDKNQKFYCLLTMNNTISSKEDVLRDYQSYLDYFVCH